MVDNNKVPPKQPGAERPPDAQGLTVNTSHITVRCACGHEYDIVVDLNKLMPDDLAIVQHFLRFGPP